MNRSTMKTANIDALVRSYAESAVAHLSASDEGDYNAANRAHDLIAAVYSELRARGREAQERLLSLLGDPRAEVRSWSAAHALEFAPSRGEPVLTELSRAGGAIGMSAEMTLREWRKGSLRFP